MLVIDMGGVQPVEAGDLGLQPRLLHQALIARCDSLGHGELVGLPLAHVLQPANAGVAGECRGYKPGFSLVVLPHRRIERAEGRVGIETDLVVLVALPHDAAFALFDLGRQPGHIEMVERLQPRLHIDAGAHGL